MVHENKYHPLPQQGRFVQAKAGQVTPIKLLPRLLGRQRCESCRKVSALAIQPGQQGPSQSIPSVSQIPSFSYSLFVLTQPQPHSSY